MSHPTPLTDAYDPTASASALVRVLDEYVAALEKGTPPDPAALQAAHPELASQLQSCLAALDFIHRTERPVGAMPARLGDFQIVREVGRGGMGVVYEAEQISLKRRVALKVLRFAASPDVEALQRFQREAETVARLHHTNIVPVFAVGCEQGVHYYAMQFIEGRGLDKVHEKQQTPCDEAARWGVQAAEALAYAHARGIVHRDIKPSNLLLDAEGVVWLTDFGLARRADEATLTATGLLLGTPRYMSPEQASSVRQPVGEKSDIYSLGATLYELATGAPVHDGDTPQRIIAQILEGEPTPPSAHRADVPRDLETILLKCLNREPERRYPTAQSLADDLRRFLNGDPIQARRPSLRERASRWLTRHRRSVQAATGAALVVLVATLGVMISMTRLERWLQGRLFLATDGPVLTAEVLTPEGRLATSRFTVPTEEPVVLAAGDYQVRLRGRGFFDEIYQVRIDRGRERAFDVSLAEQRPWDPLAVARCSELFAVDGRTDLLVLSDEGLSRRHGATGETIWSVRLDEKGDPRLKGFRWNWQIDGRPSGRGDKDRRPLLVAPAPDLDGDHIADLLWTSRRQAAVLAMSGKDGRVLWCWQAPLPRFAPDSRFRDEKANTGIVLGAATLHDLDGDGILDPVVTCAQQLPAEGEPLRWVEALSGKTGQALWQFALDVRWLTPQAGVTVPDGSLWNNMLGLGSSVSSGSHSHPDLLYSKDFMLTSGGVIVPTPAVVLVVGNTLDVVMTAGPHGIVLDARTGRLRRPPIPLGFWPLREPQFVDSDCDGRPEMLALGYPAENKPPPNSAVGVPPIPAGVRLNTSFPPDEDRLTLTAIALDTGRPLWSETLRGYWGWNWFQEPFDWPLFADLEGDGQREIIVPTGDFTGETKWSGVEVRAAATGQVRWRHRVMQSSRYGQLLQVNRMLVGPDLDGDGTQDLFVAVPDGLDFTQERPFSSVRVLNYDKDYRKTLVRVDALSGADGHALWWSTFPVRHGALTTSPHPSLNRLHWWHAGDDGWPQLVVPYLPGSPQGNELHEALVVSAGSGRLLRRSSDTRDVRTADLDGDGVAELLSFRPERGDASDQGGQLSAIRGRSPEVWRRLGGYWQAAPDLDGDGRPDLLRVIPPENRDDDDKKRHREAALRIRDATDKILTEARSSRDGRLLWETEITDGKSLSNWEQSRYQRIVSAECDLDGDGIMDLLASGKMHCNYMSEPGFSPLVAISGRTGQLLWAADMKVTLWNGPQLLTCRDLDGDSRPEVLFVSASDWDWERGPNGARSTNDWHYWLAVFHGATGRLAWRQPLCERNQSGANGGPARVPFSFVLTDLDGDGQLDLLTEGGLPDRKGEVHAFRGADGSPLWVWKPIPQPINNRGGTPGRPTLAVGELGGRRVVGLLRVITRKGPKGYDVPYAEVQALDAGRGEVLWTSQHEVDSSFNDFGNGAIRSHVMPLFVRLGEGRQGVAIWTAGHSNPGQVVLLDERGQVIGRRAMAFRLREQDRRHQRANPEVRYSPVYSDLFRVWCHDLDGDGRDECLALTADRLVVCEGDLSREKWSWPLPDMECGLLEITPAAEGRAATLMARAGGRVVGLRGSDGRVLWSCAGSGTPQAVLATSPDEDSPTVLYTLDDEVTVCRRAQPPQDASLAIGFVPYAKPEEEDPREVLPLPWNAITDLPPLFPSSPWGIALALAFLSWAQLVVPWTIVRRAVRQRRPSWGFLLGAWIGLVWGGVCLAYLALLNDDASFRISQWGWLRFVTSLGRQTLSLAPWGVPFLVMLMIVKHLTLQRSWKWLGLLALASGLGAVLIALVWLRLLVVGDDNRPYSRRGWLDVMPTGIYLVGCVLGLGWLGGRLWRGIKGLAGARQPGT